ncbi:MAG: ABC transporter ATP-binding protein [Myxococcota bacterium]
MLAIDIRGLSKSFRAPPGVGDLVRGRLRGGEVAALKDVTLSVERGEILGVVGENGAGKTTLLRVLAGLLAPTSGRALVLGEDVARAPAAFRARVTYVTADDRTFSLRLTGRENLAFFATLYGWRRGERDGRVAERLAAVGLEAAADRAVGQYSTGMRARLALARGLLGAAELFLIDEPTRGIDPRAAAALRRLLADLVAGGRTLIVATHSFEDLAALCERAALLDAGRLMGVLSIAEAQRRLVPHPEERLA